MSVSDRERVEGFHRVLSSSSTVPIPASERPALTDDCDRDND
jgi:hypothetical protein